MLRAKRDTCHGISRSKSAEFIRRNVKNIIRYFTSHISCSWWPLIFRNSMWFLVISDFHHMSIKKWFLHSLYRFCERQTAFWQTRDKVKMLGIAVGRQHLILRRQEDRWRCSLQSIPWVFFMNVRCSVGLFFLPPSTSVSGVIKL
jgi:hypothetical protein